MKTILKSCFKKLVDILGETSTLVLLAWKVLLDWYNGRFFLRILIGINEKTTDEILGYFSAGIIEGLHEGNPDKPP